MRGGNSEDPYEFDSLGIAIAGKMAYTAFGGMGHRAAQFFGGDFLSGNLLDNRRAGDVHVAFRFTMNTQSVMAGE